MANTVVITRKHIIFGICIPLAALLGFLLSEPFDYGTLIFVGILTLLLVTPALIRWHHALLIASCYTQLRPIFLPGQPTLWAILACVSFFFLVVNRSMGHKVDFFRVSYISWTIIALAAVILITSFFTGGIGIGQLGSRNGGGKRYFYALCAILLYFGLSTTTIQRKYVNLAVGFFFLSACTALLGYLAVFSSAFNFLYSLFPIDAALGEMTNLPDQDFFDSGVFRLGSVGIAGVAVFCFLIARHGARGLLDIHKPWRPLLVLLCGLAALCSGFRANLIFIVLTFAVVFYLEGLVRSKYFPALLCLGVFTVAIGLPFTRHMPLSVQRTISFLPVEVDPIAMNSAEDSTNWRLEMWQEILPTLPTYFWKGKGFTFDREKLAYIQSLEMSGYIPSYETSLIAGDYHSGPLSVIVPFGIWGVIAFLAFVYAGGRALYLNYKYGDPALKTVNRVLFALYVVRFIFFIFIFGSLYSDLIYFASLAGFGISLNGGAAKNPNYQRRTVVKYG